MALFYPHLPLYSTPPPTSPFLFVSSPTPSHPSFFIFYSPPPLLPSVFFSIQSISTSSKSRFHWVGGIGWEGVVKQFSLFYFSLLFGCREWGVGRWFGKRFKKKEGEGEFKRREVWMNEPFFLLGIVRAGKIDWTHIWVITWLFLYSCGLLFRPVRRNACSSAARRRKSEITYTHALWPSSGCFWEQSAHFIYVPRAEVWIAPSKKTPNARGLHFHSDWKHFSSNFL